MHEKIFSPKLLAKKKQEAYAREHEGGTPFSQTAQSICADFSEKLCWTYLKSFMQSGGYFRRKNMPQTF